MNPEELYQEVIMDHASRPRNQTVMEDATSTVEAENPVCGDDLCLYLRCRDATTVEKTTFKSQACAICTASASLLTTKIRNLPIDEAERISKAFQHCLTAREEPTDDETAGLGNLRGLLGVRKFPMRIKCATLAWHALDQALRAAREGVAKVELIEEEQS
jgi:nitrogen fixation NifU-like protein